MATLDAIKTQIQALYASNPHIHVNVSITKPKVHLTNEPVVIKGVYPHIFQVEELSSGFRKCYTIQYIDVLTGHVEILELNNSI